MATTTSRLRLRKPDPDPNTGDFIDIATDINAPYDQIDAAVGALVVTSSTRPATPWAGQIIQESDTGYRMYVHNGTSPASAGWQQVLKAGSTFVGNVTVSGSASFTGPVAASNLGAMDVQVFTSNGTWFKPNKARVVQIKCVGGGGAAGGAPATGASQVSGGGGGQGGAYAESWFDASTLASSVAVTVGAGGASVSGADGGSGATSSFGGLVSAAGGSGGFAGASGGTNFKTPGGAGSQAMTGQIQVKGDDGGATLRLGTVSGQVLGGFGGGTALAGSVGPGASGATGDSYGGGGSGPENGPSTSAKSGGAGAAGVVIVTTW